ncbi:MAG: hypothetical protein EKK46_17945 [Rhodocyclaceae bacterium]|nr:MAG: hypothetical protein EKK46_17945 [Rhodocyclaceae bacterium]
MGDIICIKVGEVYRYLAVVLDRYSCAVSGWSFGHRKTVALNRAVANQHPRLGQLGSLAVRHMLLQLGKLPKKPFRIAKDVALSHVYGYACTLT